MLNQQFEIWICLNMVLSALGSDHGWKIPIERFPEGNPSLLPILIP